MGAVVGDFLTLDSFGLGYLGFSLFSKALSAAAKMSVTFFY